MSLKPVFLIIVVLLVLPQQLGFWQAHAAPTEFPTGVTIHNAAKAYPGLTLFNYAAEKELRLIDMDGNTVNRWVHPQGARVGPLGKPLPGGKLMTLYGNNDDRGVAILDWDGNLVWEFFKDGWNLNHDFQDGSAYYGPDILPNGNVLILAKTAAEYANIAAYTIFDEIIAEISPEGQVLWTWSTSDHFDQLGISQKGKDEIFAGTGRYGDQSDIYHTNSVSFLPGNPNGKIDDRFAKGHLLVSQRHTNKVFIFERATGNVIWSLDDCLAPNDGTNGQHHATMIPNWLPGAGNILIFDNGGKAGYPEENRFHTRILEVNPRTCEKVWEYDGTSSGKRVNSFFSRTRGSAQRLPNGNTLISEPTWLRIFEVTSDGEVVWEYVHPDGGQLLDNPSRVHIYRAYRVHPDWGSTERYPEVSGKKWFPW